MAETFGYPLDYPNDVWVCPITGRSVHKNLQKNLEQRIKAKALCDADLDDRATMLHLCSQSFLYWLNLWGWTYVQQVSDADGRRAVTGGENCPFITWPVQDGAYYDIDAAAKAGVSVALEKSREMGASWLVLAWFVWRMLFERDFNAAVMSRKEDLVDSKGDADSLYWKIDYIIRNLPEWMRPTIERTQMHIANVDFSSSIDGDSTNGDAFRGGRRKVGLFDEAAAMQQLKQVDMSTQDSMPCRIYVSTVVPGSYFSVLCTSGKLKSVKMHWSDHPDKGRGRSMATDPDTGEQYITSPWYEKEKAKRDATDTATNLDIDHMGAGATVFNTRQLTIHDRLYGAKAVRRAIRFPVDVRIDRDAAPSSWPVRRSVIVADDRGYWRWFDKYADLEDDGTGRIRPNQRHSFALGVDVGQGLGASLSVVSAGCADTGFKMGRWSHSETSPEELADLLFLFGYWFGGSSGCAYIAVENNGPGQVVLKRLERHRYPRIATHEELMLTGKTTRTLGFTSGRQQKKDLLGMYRGALARAEIKNPDSEALAQAATYVHYTTGGCGPVTLAEMTEDARAEHGDIVIADALCSLAMARMPYAPLTKAEPPFGSFAWRKLQQELRAKAQKRGRVRS